MTTESEVTREELAVKAAPTCVGLGVAAEGPGEKGTGKDDEEEEDEDGNDDNDDNADNDDDDDNDDVTAGDEMADLCKVKLTGILEFLFNCCNSRWFCLITV